MVEITLSAEIIRKIEHDIICYEPQLPPDEYWKNRYDDEWEHRKESYLRVHEARAQMLRRKFLRFDVEAMPNAKRFPPRILEGVEESLYHSEPFIGSDESWKKTHGKRWREKRDEYLKLLKDARIRRRKKYLRLNLEAISVTFSRIDIELDTMVYSFVHGDDPCSEM